MQNTVFIVAVLAVVGFAAARANTGQRLGFLWVVAVYIVFVAGSQLASIYIVAGAWLICAIFTTSLMINSTPDDRPSWLARSILIGALVIWPIQIATLKVSLQQEAESEAVRKASRERVGDVPAQVSGTVSFDHFIDGDEPYFLLWLEEFDELPFAISRDVFESLGATEGMRVSLSVDERDGSNGERELYVVEAGVIET